MIMVKKILLIVYLLLTSALFGCVNNKHYGNDYMQIFYKEKLDEEYYIFLAHDFRTYHEEDIDFSRFGYVGEFYVYASVSSSKPGVDIKYVKVNRKKIAVYRGTYNNYGSSIYFVSIKDFKSYQLPKP